MTPVEHSVSVVVIGRNEGERLERCLQSVQKTPAKWIREIVYVDSASSDGSPGLAEAFGVRVIPLTTGRMTAAGGRNAGWRSVDTPYVLFLDGDCVLDAQFVEHALHRFDDPDVAIVWGHLREMHPGASLYQLAMSLDWIYPFGECEFCGGNALFRRVALEQTGGFDESLAGGEEPDLCHRIRKCGWHIVHIDSPMVLHDLGISTFGQYWHRAVKSGESYARVNARTDHTLMTFWNRRTRRNYLQGGLYALLILVSLVASAAMLSVIPLLLLFALWMALAIWTAFRARWKSTHTATRFLYGLHSHFVYLPLLAGQLRVALPHHDDDHAPEGIAI